MDHGMILARGPARARHELSAEVPDHAVARLMQRDPTANVKKVLFQAGLSFMHASAVEVMEYVDRDQTFYLPAGAGLLLCEGICGQIGALEFTYARARTFLSCEMIGPDQKPIVAASADDLTMGDRVLLSAREGTFR